MMRKKKYWSGKVTKESNALDLEEKVFTFDDPKKIAKSLKRSAEESEKRKNLEAYMIDKKGITIMTQNFAKYVF